MTVNDTVNSVLIRSGTTRCIFSSFWSLTNEAGERVKAGQEMAEEDTEGFEARAT